MDEILINIRGREFWLWMAYEPYQEFLPQRNFIERFMQCIVDGTECFDDYFPCMKDGCDREHVWNWFRLFILQLQGEMDLFRIVRLLSGLELMSLNQSLR